MNYQGGYSDPGNISLQQYNPAYTGSSLDRDQSSPRDGTQYQFGHYGHRDQSPDGWVQETNLQQGGPHELHHRQSGSTHLNDTEAYNEDAMENLLKHLPSRQLESAANNAARTLHRRHSRKKSMHRAQFHELEGREDIEDMIDRASLYDADEEEKMEEAIRSMHTTMAERRSMMRRLSSRKRRVPGFFKRTKYSIGMAWKHFKDNMAELRYTLQLWHTHLKKIEGNFGTDVLSYFVFLKWLLLINIPTLLLTLGFIVVPQLLFRFLQQEPSGYSNETTFSGLELLTGDGWFAQTELYYGYYTNRTIQINSDQKYQMQIAYLFTCGGYYLLTLLILGQSILRSYRKYYIEAGGYQGIHIVFKILGSWDFGLTSLDAVKLKHRSTVNEIKEYLAGTARKKTPKTVGDWCRLFWLRTLTNLVVLGILGGAGYLVYFLSKEQTNLFGTETSQIVDKPLRLMVLPVAVGAIHLILPFIFTFIEGWERYDNPKTELYVHLIRSMVLRVSTLTVLVFYWYERVPQNTEVKCWETFMGQELYRLVIVDFIFTLLSTFFSEFVRRMLARQIEKLQDPTFAIGRNTLELIYSQALCWLGTFYAPLLSLIVILKLIFIFYVKMISVLQNCKPSERPWRATRSHTIFLGFLFLFFLCTTAAVACGIIFVTPSTECGPYRGKDVMYSVVPELVDSWKSDYPWLTTVINFIASPGFVAAVLVALGMGVYLVRTITVGRKETVQRLKQQLVLEGKDKTFLLNLLNQVSQRQYQTPTSNADRRLTQHQPMSPDMTSPGMLFKRARMGIPPL